MEQEDVLQKMHELLLEALRSRELEIFRYLTILGPALGGFGWLLYADTKANSGTAEQHVDAGLFLVITLGVLLLLLLGALYSLTLGYNYRYITLQLAKLESRLGIHSAMLNGWPKSPGAFRTRYQAVLLGRPWCTPPAVIQVFWYAFLTAIGGVTLTVWLWRHDDPAMFFVRSISAIVGIVCFWTALLAPFRFGYKLQELAKAEEKMKGEWAPRHHA